jgi:hypothetical protein
LVVGIQKIAQAILLILHVAGEGEARLPLSVGDIDGVLGHVAS